MNRWASGGLSLRDVFFTAITRESIFFLDETFPVLVLLGKVLLVLWLFLFIILIIDILNISQRIVDKQMYVIFANAPLHAECRVFMLITVALTFRLNGQKSPL